MTTGYSITFTGSTVNPLTKHVPADSFKYDDDRRAYIFHSGSKVVAEAPAQNIFIIQAEPATN